MAKFKSKPFEIEAIQFDGTNCDEITKKFDPHGDGIRPSTAPDYCAWLNLTTVSGETVTAFPGDWVIKDARPHTFYPCDDEVFKAKYEKVEE